MLLSNRDKAEQSLFKQILPNVAESVQFRRGGKGDSLLFVAGFSPSVAVLEMNSVACRRLQDVDVAGQIAKFDLLLKPSYTIPFVHVVSFREGSSLLGTENGSILLYRDPCLRNPKNCFSGHLARIVAWFV